MRRHRSFGLGFAFVLAFAVAVPLPVEAGPAEAPGIGHRLLWYLPNRVFDVLDLARARIRVGPGFAGGARATYALTIYGGSYESYWVGLPGPRGRTKYPVPFGREKRSGRQLNTADRTSRGPGTPRYGAGEVGLDAQLGIIGPAVGLDPFEAIDLIAGFFLIDPGGDDF